MVKSMQELMLIVQCQKVTAGQNDRTAAAKRIAVHLDGQEFYQ